MLGSAKNKVNAHYELQAALRMTCILDGVENIVEKHKKWKLPAFSAFPQSFLQAAF